jgi:hypothetical protein
VVPPPTIVRSSPRWAAIAIGVFLIVASLILWQTTRRELQPASVAFTATLEDVGGAVSVRPSAADGWAPAKKGLMLYAGAALRTGGDGWSLVRFPGNHSVAVRPDAELTIQNMRGSGDQLLDLEFQQTRGEAEYVIPAINAPGFYYKVTTPAGQVIAMQPTRCTVRVADDGATWIDVSEGTVMVSARWLNQTLSAGQSLLVPADAVVSATATVERPSQGPLMMPTVEDWSPVPAPTATPSPRPTATFVPTRPASTPQPPTGTPAPPQPTAQPEPTERPEPTETPNPPEPTETEEPDPTPRATKTEEPDPTPDPTETEEPTETPEPTETDEPPKP